MCSSDLAEGDGCSVALQGCEASTSVGRAIMRDELGVEVAVACSCCVVCGFKLRHGSCCMSRMGLFSRGQ